MAWSLVAFLVAGVLLFLMRRPEERYTTSTRPDGLYKVDIYKRPNRLGFFPGQSGDVPGRAILRDNHDKVLGEVELEMVQLGDAIEWQAHSVSIRAVVDWPLPTFEPTGVNGALDGPPSRDPPSR